MTSVTLILGGFFTALAAVLYTAAGHVMWGRFVPPEWRLRWRMFALWWFGIGAAALLTTVLNLAPVTGPSTLALHVVVYHARTLVVCAALWGLLAYLLALFTPRREALAALSAFYAAFYLLVLFDVTAGRPLAVDVGRWEAELVYQRAAPPWLTTVKFTALVAPPFLGGLALLAFLPSERLATHRYRIALVSTSLVGWSFVAVLVPLPFLQGSDAFQLGIRMLGLATAGAIYMAYVPPQWVSRRLGVTAPVRA